MEEFISQFKDHISFTYTLFDRLIFRGYIRNLFSEGTVIKLLRNLGFTKTNNGVLRSLTDHLNLHIEKKATQHGAPLLWWNNLEGSDDQMKKEYLKRTYLNKKSPGVLCVVKRMENTRTAWFREITTKSGKKFNKLYFCNKLIKHYYIYIYDQELGLCYLKIATYMPFYVEFYCNGHYYVQRQLGKSGISYQMNENSFVEVSDLERLKELSENIEGSMIEERIKTWWDQFFRFDKGERSTRSGLLEHQWYTTQAEISTNIIFKSAKYFNDIYKRFLQKHHRIGHPDVLKEVFEEIKTPVQTVNRQRKFELNANLRHWFGGNSIKMYNKGGYMLRVETTINKPEHLRFKLKKPACYLRAYYWYGLGCNNRYLNMLADIDVSLIDPELRQKMEKSFIKENGKTVAAPDLRKESQRELIHALLNARFLVREFMLKELKDNLSDTYSKTAKIRYEIQKLLVRGLIRKQQSSNNYIVTKAGYAWLYISYCQTNDFSNPLLSKQYKKETKQNLKQPDNFEKAMKLLNEGLTLVCQELNIAA